MVQSVESAPVHAARDVGAVMVFPVVEEGKVVVPGVYPKDQERAEPVGHARLRSLQIASEAMTIMKSGVATSAVGSAWWCA